MTQQNNNDAQLNKKLQQTSKLGNYQLLLQGLSSISKDSLVNCIQTKSQILLNLIGQINKLSEDFDKKIQNKEIQKQFHEKADLLLQISVYIFINNFQNWNDVLFLEQLIQFHIKLNQLKYALTIYENNVGMLIHIEKYKYLTTLYKFTKVLSQGLKIGKQIVKCTKQFLIQQRQILGASQNTIAFNYNQKQEKQENKENKETQKLLFSIRNKLIERIIKQLYLYQIKEINPYFKKNIVQSLSYIHYRFPISEFQIVVNLSSIIPIFEKYDINIKYQNNQQHSYLSCFFVSILLDDLQKTMNKHFLSRIIAHVLINELPKSPNQHQKQNQFSVCSKYVNNLVSFLCKNKLRVSNQPITNLLISKNTIESPERNYLTYIDLIQVLTIHLGTLLPKSQLYNHLLQNLNNLIIFPDLTKQKIFSSIIQRFSSRQLSQNQYNFKAFIISQYRKLINSKKQTDKQIKLIIINRISQTIFNEIEQLSKKHGSLNYLTHLLTMVYYWVIIYRKTQKNNTSTNLPSFVNEKSSDEIYQYISKIIKQIKQQLIVRFEDSKNQNERNELTVCLFRIDQLQL